MTAFVDDFMDLINKMLQPNPSRRITIDEIKAHAWFNGPIESQTTLKAELERRKTIIELAKLRKEIAVSKTMDDGKFAYLRRQW